MGKVFFIEDDIVDPKLIVRPLTTLSLKLLTQSISSIKQLRDGDIWVITHAGLTITHPEKSPITTNLKYNTNKSSVLSANHMTRTYESRSGLIWQGTWTSEFSKFAPNSLQFQTLNTGGSKTTRGIANGNIWFGTPEGL
jgi:ligand-binding sensor domain-containing protein